MLLKGLLLESCEFLEDFSAGKYKSLEEFDRKKITPNHYFELSEIHNFLSTAGIMNGLELDQKKLCNKMTLKQNITLNYLISKKPNWLISFARGYKGLKSALQDNYRENELECLNLCGLDNRGLDQSEQDKKFFFERGR